MSNHNEIDETTATVASTADEENTNLDDYAAEVELPEYAAPVEASFNFPLVQYAKGVLVVSGRKQQKYTGFQIEQEQSAEIDALLDSQDVNSGRVRHRNGNEGNYWQLNTLTGYILCKAVPDGYGLDVWQKTGIAYVWNPYRGTYMFGSQLQCIFFSSGLIKLGYTQPLVLTFSRTVTEYFVNRVLCRQEWMINLVKKALKKHNKPADLAFYSYGMELLKGEEVTTKGGGSYFAPAIAMPSPLTVAYVKAQETPADHLAIIEEFLPVLPQWAQAASVRLVQPPRDNSNVVSPETEEPEAEEE